MATFKAKAGPFQIELRIDASEMAQLVLLTQGGMPLGSRLVPAKDAERIFRHLIRKSIKEIKEFFGI
ncbi:MAG: hypothetical protein AB1468_01805 [Candidatus Micrarchaeota archaeon]